MFVVYTFQPVSKLRVVRIAEEKGSSGNIMTTPLFMEWTDGGVASVQYLGTTAGSDGIWGRIIGWRVSWRINPARVAFSEDSLVFLWWT